MARVQRDRVYELVIGDPSTPNQSVVLDKHQIIFEVKKSSDNSDKSNTAKLQLYNLSDTALDTLELDNPIVEFSVGYASDEGLKRLLVGEVVHHKTRKKGTERITYLDVSQNYTGLNYSILSDSVPPGSKIRDAIQTIRRGFGFGVIPGHVLRGEAIERQLLYGYPLSGSPKDMLNKLSKTYGFEWRIDNNTLYVNDVDKAQDENFVNAPVISPTSGLIESPYYDSGDSKRVKTDPAKKNGVRFQILLNPEIIPGQIIKLEDVRIQGFFKVDDAKYHGDYRGDKWYTDVVCSVIEKVNKE